MKRFLIVPSICMFMLFFHNQAGAATVAVEPQNGIMIDGVDYLLYSGMPSTGDPSATLPPPDDTGLMWEWNAQNNCWKVCLCRMVAFRALQALERHLAADGFDSGEIDIVTGWSTDGPEELYCDIMPWVQGDNFSYAASITSPAQLTVDDAWYEFTAGGTKTYRVASLASNYAFAHDTAHPGYHSDWDFFDYRTHYKTSASADDEKDYFANVIRGQVVDNFLATTAFAVTGGDAVAVPAVSDGGAAGLVVLLSISALLYFRRNIGKKAM